MDGHRDRGRRHIPEVDPEQASATGKILCDGPVGIVGMIECPVTIWLIV